MTYFFALLNVIWAITITQHLYNSRLNVFFLILYCALNCLLVFLLIYVVDMRRDPILRASIAARWQRHRGCQGVILCMTVLLVAYGHWAAALLLTGTLCILQALKFVVRVS